MLKVSEKPGCGGRRFPLLTNTLMDSIHPKRLYLVDLVQRYCREKSVDKLGVKNLLQLALMPAGGPGTISGRLVHLTCTWSDTL